jgi:hypothetical protein
MQTTPAFLVTLLCAGWFAAEPAQAAAVKKLVLTPAQERVFVVWTHYLSAGPETWAKTHAPPFTPAIRTTIWDVLKTETQAQSLANPMIDYLLWRRSLNPRRFAANHPSLSPALAQLLSTPSLPAGVPPPTFTPVPQSAVSPQTVTPPPLVNPSPQTISPSAIPEPRSWILAVGMTGLALWWRRRSSGRGQP